MEGIRARVARDTRIGNLSPATQARFLLTDVFPRLAPGATDLVAAYGGEFPLPAQAGRGWLKTG